MKIRTKLYFSSFILVILIVMIAVIMFHASDQINREIEMYHAANKTIKDLSDLTLITYEYLIYHEKRMKEQWSLQYDSLGKTIKRIEKECVHPKKHHALHESIKDNYKGLGLLFSDLQVTVARRKRLIEENKPQTKIDVTLTKKDTIADEIMMKSRFTISEAFRLSAMIRQETNQTQQEANTLILFSTIGFVIFASCISLLIIKAITRPINKLVKSAEIIGKGDLEHRVEIKTRDEIGVLANTFNNMVADLKKITASRDELNKEITERKRAEEGLRQTGDYLENMINYASVPIIVWNPESRITRFNRSFERMTGYSEKELIGQEFGILFPEATREESLIKISRTLAGKYWESVEIPIFCKDRDIRIVLWNSSNIYTEDGGTLLAIIAQGQDITDRKQAEEELEKHREHLEELVKVRTAELDKRISEVEQLNSAMVNLLADLRVSKENLELTTRQLSDANKELESFSYSVSHDLRAPLRAIDGFSQILVEDYGDKLGENGQHQLDVIQGSARQMGQLIDDLLAFSRLGRKEIKTSEIDMGVLAQEVFEQLQHGETERLNVDTLPPAKGDRAMIREVLVNFLSNAMKFTRPGKAPVIEVTGTVDGNETVYSVKDKGVGFDMKYSDKLFQVFQRLHSAEEFEGTGIGLALVQRIIHRHGGRVWAEGKVNKGATFYFTLPGKSDK